MSTLTMQSLFYTTYAHLVYETRIMNKHFVTFIIILATCGILATSDRNRFPAVSTRKSRTQFEEIRIIS